MDTFSDETDHAQLRRHLMQYEVDAARAFNQHYTTAGLYTPVNAVGVPTSVPATQASFQDNGALSAAAAAQFGSGRTRLVRGSPDGTTLPAISEALEPIPLPRAPRAGARTDVQPAREQGHGLREGTGVLTESIQVLPAPFAHHDMASSSPSLSNEARRSMWHGYLWAEDPRGPRRASSNFGTSQSQAPRRSPATGRPIFNPASLHSHAQSQENQSMCEDHTENRGPRPGQPSRPSAGSALSAEDLKLTKEAERLVRIINETLWHRSFIRYKPLPPASSTDLRDKNCCDICYVDYRTASPENVVEDAIKLPACGHIFGSCCLTEWFQTQKSHSWCCPYCRKKIVPEREPAYDLDLYMEYQRQKPLLSAKQNLCFLKRILATRDRKRPGLELPYMANLKRRGSGADPMGDESHPSSRLRFTAPEWEARVAGDSAFERRLEPVAPNRMNQGQPRGIDQGSWGDAQPAHLRRQRMANVEAAPTMLGTRVSQYTDDIGTAVYNLQQPGQSQSSSLHAFPNEVPPSATRDHHVQTIFVPPLVPSVTYVPEDILPAESSVSPRTPSSRPAVSSEFDYTEWAEIDHSGDSEFESGEGDEAELAQHPELLAVT